MNKTRGENNLEDEMKIRQEIFDKNLDAVIQLRENILRKELKKLLEYFSKKSIIKCLEELENDELKNQDMKKTNY